MKWSKDGIGLTTATTLHRVSFQSHLPTKSTNRTYNTTAIIVATLGELSVNLSVCLFEINFSTIFPKA
jgi:hypothetical protein